MEENKKIEEPKHQGKLRALDNLSLGISIVAAIGIGFAIGYGLKHLTGYTWTLWVGLFWGVAAAALNISRAYKRAKKEFEGLENDPRYAYRAKHGDKSYSDDDE